jgi:hypothetical protein
MRILAGDPVPVMKSPPPGAGKTVLAHRTGGTMLTLDIQTTLLLDEPTSDDGFVTWLEAAVIDDDFTAEHTTKVGHAHVALVHVGMIADAGRSLRDVLHADSGELAILYEIYFEDDWIRGDLIAGGKGSDLLYVSELELDVAYTGRNVDVAIILRLCDTLGAGCAIAVVPYAPDDELERWFAAGFKVTEPAQPGDVGYLHRNTSLLRRHDSRSR